MRKNKYASDFEVYMNANIKDAEEQLSSTSKINHYQNIINAKPLISDNLNQCKNYLTAVIPVKTGIHFKNG